MIALSRRQFLSRSAAGIAAAGVLKADPLRIPIGFQSYSVREMIGQDFAGTLRQMAAIGYRAIEMCSPPGYEKAGFGPLVKLKASEVRQTIKAAGLRCESCHYGFRELRENLDARIAYAKELGLKHMVISSFGLRREATLDDWRKAAEESNKIGEQTKKAGLQLGFHNHNGEFAQLGGVLIYDELLSRFDPKLVKMQFQTAVISIGYDVTTYLSKYPGRFASLHLADWSATEKKSAPVGKGVIDWKKAFAAAKTAGVENYFVEMDLEALKASFPYLHALKV